MTLNDIINELRKIEKEYGDWEINHIDTQNVCKNGDAINILLHDDKNTLCIGLSNNDQNWRREPEKVPFFYCPIPYVNLFINLHRLRHGG